jgi:hypothetical protein
VAEFLVEMYASRRAAKHVAAATDRARRAAADLERGGVSVRFVRTLFVPEDETCFLLFEAGNSDVVRMAVERAGLSFDRLSETVTEPVLVRPQE